MEHSHETRRYLAKVSRIGIVAAIVYALIYGMLHFFLMPSKYADGFTLSDLLLGRQNVFPEITVTAVGLLALAVCAVLSLTAKARPDLVDQGWIIGGKAVLLAAPFGFVQGVFGMSHLLTVISGQTDFLFSFATLATVYVGYAMNAKGISVNQAFQSTDRKTYTLRVLKNTAVILGVMLVSLLVVIGRSRHTYGEAFFQQSVAMQVDFMALDPIRVAAPVALAVILLYPLLSLAARLDGSPRKGRFGKGTILLGWVTLALSLWHQIMAVLIQTRILDYTASSLMGDLQDLQAMQAMQKVVSVLGTLLGIWTLCRIMPRVRESKIALWGIRSVLGVIILRHLFTWIVGVIRSAIQLKNQSGVGIIGGMDYSLTVLTAKLESWANILFTVLSIAALAVLTVGLTRRCRVSKAFWAVPALTAAGILTSLLVGVVWELFLRSTNTDSALTVSAVTTVITSVLTLLRSLIGVLALTRAPAEEVPPPPAATEGEESNKPRVEDYLYQL